jgi:hypothetical protein
MSLYSCLVRLANTSDTVNVGPIPHNLLQLAMMFGDSGPRQSSRFQNCFGTSVRTFCT